MMKRLLCLAGLAGLFGPLAPVLSGQGATIAEKTKDMQKLPGYFNLY